MFIAKIRSFILRRPTDFTTFISVPAITKPNECLQQIRRFCNQPRKLQNWEIVDTRAKKRQQTKIENERKEQPTHKGEENRITICKLLRVCTAEPDIDKYKNEYNQCGYRKTEDYYIALIQAYAGSNLLHKAKNMINDDEIANHVSATAIKSELVCELAQRGDVTTALAISSVLGKDTTAKAAISLTHHLREPGQLNEHLKLLDILKKSGPVSWYDGYSNTIHYCVKNRMMWETKNMLFELKKKKIELNEILIQAFLILGETSDVDVGLKLFEQIEGITQIYTIRRILGLLQTTATSANNRQASDYIWSLYQKHKLDYNTSAYMLRLKALTRMGAISEANILFKEDIVHLEAYKVNLVKQVLHQIRSKNENEDQINQE